MALPLQSAPCLWGRFSRTIMEHLPILVAKSAKLDYVTYKGIHYRQGECSAKSECPEPSIRPPSDQLEYHFRVNFDVMDDEAREKDFDLDMMEFASKLCKLGLDAVLFPDHMKVEFVNPHGVNNDHRGSDHTEIGLDFHDYWVLRGPKLRDFVEGYFRVKSHKFENWYELFGDVQKCELVQNHVNEPEKTATLTFTFDFDHGS